MATIIHKGIKLAYDDQGAGKPAFVFVHGWVYNRSLLRTSEEKKNLALVTSGSYRPGMMRGWLVMNPLLHLITSR